MKVINRIYIYDNRVKNITSFTLQLAHFRNMLVILIHKLKDTLGYYPTSEGLLYSLLVDKLNLKRTKDKSKIEKLNNLLSIINSDKELLEFMASNNLFSFSILFSSFVLFKFNLSTSKEYNKPSFIG